MLRIPAALLRLVTDAAEAAYPDECCGLLAGRIEADGGAVVTRIVPSANVASPRRQDRFEVDPKVRFELMRALAGGPERLIGHYHSHPDHAAEPSAHDLAMAFEPELLWVIVAVADGRAGDVRAFLLDPGARAFRAIGLRAGGNGTAR